MVTRLQREAGMVDVERRIDIDRWRKEYSTIREVNDQVEAAEDRHTDISVHTPRPCGNRLPAFQRDRQQRVDPARQCFLATI